MRRVVGLVGLTIELVVVLLIVLPVLAKASPVSYVNSGDPPFLIVQGREDKTVPPAQSQELYDRLMAAGVPATLQLVEHAGHGLVPTPPDATINPSAAALAQQMLAFLNAKLR